MVLTEKTHDQSGNFYRKYNQRFFAYSGQPHSNGGRFTVHVRFVFDEKNPAVLIQVFSGAAIGENVMHSDRVLTDEPAKMMSIAKRFIKTNMAKDAQFVNSMGFEADLITLTN